MRIMCALRIAANACVQGTRYQCYYVSLYLSIIIRKTRIWHNSVDNTFSERSYWLRPIKRMMYHFILVVHEMLNKSKMIHYAHHAFYEMQLRSNDEYRL